MQKNSSAAVLEEVCLQTGANPAVVFTFKTTPVKVKVKAVLDP